MRFRPCIDIHEGVVKQIVGSTLTETGADTNFQSIKPPSFFAEIFRRHFKPGGHVVMLGSGNENAALEALSSWPGGFQIGGGINPDNALRYLNAGASHVIVTSYVFSDGKINWENLKSIREVCLKERLVLDLSCTKKGEEYYILTDRWSRITKEHLSKELFQLLADYCSEFLVHAADCEGKRQGIDKGLVSLLGEIEDLPVTYAGGISSFEDIEDVYRHGKAGVDYTAGSALDIFGGDISLLDIKEYEKEIQGTLGD